MAHDATAESRTEVKKIIVMQNTEVLASVKRGEVIEAVKTQFDTWRITAPARLAGNHLIDEAEAQRAYTQSQAAQYLTETWGVEVHLFNVYEWRSAGRFPNAVTVSSPGYCGRRWLIPESDLVLVAETHSYKRRLRTSGTTV